MNPWTTNRDGIFLITCLCFAIAGCGSPIFALCQGYSDYKRAIGSFQPQASNRDPKLAANISPNFETAYLKQHHSGALKRRVESLWECIGTDTVSAKRITKGASPDAPFYPSCHFCFETLC